MSEQVCVTCGAELPCGGDIRPNEAYDIVPWVNYADHLEDALVRSLESPKAAGT